MTFVVSEPDAPLSLFKYLLNSVLYGSSRLAEMISKCFPAVCFNAYYFQLL